MRFCLLLSAFVILTLYGCSGLSTESDKETSPNPPETKISTAAQIDTLNNVFSLDHFKGFPKDIEGCSCYFSGTKEQSKAGEYIYVADFDSIAYISVNKELIRLKLVSTTREIGTFGNHDYKDVYSNDNYTVTVDVKYKSASGDETWWNEGTITVDRKQESKVTAKFVGECGC